MGHPGVALRDLEASRDALSRSRYQPQPTERRLSCSHRVTFLTGANRDFTNWRRQSILAILEPNHKDQEPTRSQELQRLTAADDAVQRIMFYLQHRPPTSADQPDLRRRETRRIVSTHPAVAAAQKTDAQSAASYRRQHVPDAVAHDHGSLAHPTFLWRKRHATLPLPRLTVWRTSKPSNCGCST